MYRDYDAVIFDMDGTLIDSMGVWPEVDKKFFEEEHITDIPDTFVQDLEGISIHKVAEYFIEHFDIDYSVDGLIDKWNEMAGDEYRYSVLYKKGAKDFLEKLKESGVKIGIATSNSRELVMAADERLHLTEYADFIATSNEIKNGKPEPDIYLYVADRLNVNPKRCLVFEDVPAGIIAGNRAGMDTCGIYDESSKHLDDEKKRLAKYYIKDYTEL